MNSGVWGQALVGKGQNDGDLIHADFLSSQAGSWTFARGTYAFLMLVSRPPMMAFTIWRFISSCCSALRSIVRQTGSA
jgi:hypothetical protein